jgi:ubiquitin-protein ligase
MSAWWGTRANVSARLRVEVDAMRLAFGNNFRLIVPPMGGKLHWHGHIEINLSTLAPHERAHMLKIEYPNDYPFRPAEAYVLRPTIISRKHQYEDGQLCLFNPKDGEHYGWNPSSSTAVTVTAWAIQWLYAYYTWIETGDWPGIEERIDPSTPLPPRR